MSLLLDTHVALWGIAAEPLLDDDFLDRLRHDPDILLSPVTLWEITIKQTAGKLGGPPDLAERVRDMGFVSCRSRMRTRSRRAGFRCTIGTRSIGRSSPKPWWTV